MVSIVVLGLVNRTVEENIEAQYLNITKSAAENIRQQVITFMADRNENIESLESRISEISQYARADMNLFNSSGRLLATNQRLILRMIYLPLSSILRPWPPLMRQVSKSLWR